MTVVSVTRLHVRAWWYLPWLAFSTFRITREIKRSAGFRGGLLAGDAQLGAWTISLWGSPADMRAFRNSGAHLAALPRLLTWCDEASFTHWETAPAGLPPCEEAYRRLRDEGRTSKVSRPSPEQRAGRTVSASVPRPLLSLRAMNR
jgi:hypothetical protein